MKKCNFTCICPKRCRCNLRIGRESILTPIVVPQSASKKRMEDKISNLFQWLNLSENFQFSDAIEVIDTEDSGRGVYLQKQIKLKKNNVLISIPSSYQLNYHSVLFHIANFNKSISIPNVTSTSSDDLEVHSSEDPRYNAYSILSQDFLLQLSSFQLLCLYILAEWILLPQWTSDTSIVSFWKPFFDVWPTESELGSIPTVWNCQRKTNLKDQYNNLTKSLSYASLSHMQRITKLVQNDWELIYPIIEGWNEMYPTQLTLDEQFDKFLHIYFIINSRCLYCEIPLKKDSEDRIASNFTMVPLVDFLNHSDTIDKYCYPQVNIFKKDGISGVGQFMIRVGDHEYNQMGEQIFLNYGPHSNDFLLNEYGFVIQNNKWDFIDITETVMALLEQNSTDNKEKMIQLLKENDYWGDYTVNHDEISYRTSVALSLVVTKDFERVKKFMLGYISEDYFIPKIKPTLIEMLKHIITDATDKIATINSQIEENSDVIHQWYFENLRIIQKDYIKIVQNHLERLDDKL